MKKMKVIEQLSIHDNRVLRVYVYDETVSKQTSIAPWQRHWRDNVYEENENERGIIPPWQPSFKCEFIFICVMIMWVDRRDPLYDNDVDVITYLKKL